MNTLTGVAFASPLACRNITRFRERFGFTGDRSVISTISPGWMGAFLWAYCEPDTGICIVGGDIPVRGEEGLREYYDAYGAMGPIQRLDFLQADNQMRTFARESGGQAYFPRFYGEFPAIFGNIHAALRNQYSLVYNPSNQAKDGKFRKIKVELVAPGTSEPLRVVDEKGKPLKYQIISKQGYTAPRPVE